MALPQIQTALAACDRRDADLAAQYLEATYAANAGIHSGDEGHRRYIATLELFRNTARPRKASSKPKNTPYSSAEAAIVAQAEVLAAR